MTSKVQSTQTEKSAFLPRRFCGVKVKHIFNFGASLLLPLVLGVFTVVITIQQQELATKQRDEDRKEAEKLRELERNISNQQRENDQRVADQLREQERYLSSERYENEVLDNYVKEMAKLLKENNGSLTLDEVTSTIARANTLSIFRQLNSQRNVRVIRFLYEAKQLTKAQTHAPLDLSTAELSHMDFRDLAINKKTLDNISLTGIFLLKATFADIEMTNVNFSHTQFDMANFSKGEYRNANFEYTIFNEISFSLALLENLQFSSAHLKHVNFSCSQLDNVDFTRAELDNVIFSSKPFKNINFESAKLKNIEFSGTQLDAVSFTWAELNEVTFSSKLFKNINFESAKLKNIDFSNTQLDHVSFSAAEINDTNFSRIQIKYTDFTHASLTNIDFSFSIFTNVKFSSAILVNVTFSNSQFENVEFLSSTLQNVDFSSSKLRYSDFSRATLVNVSFLSINSVSANFHDSQASYTDFQKAHLVATNFTSANLSGSNLQWSNVKRSVFIRSYLPNVNFHGANLYKVNFRNVFITLNRLKNALSIDDAVLSNGTVLNNTNLLTNGYAECNTPLNTSWTLHSGMLSIKASDDNPRNCRFVLQSYSTGASMSQRINLSFKWNSTIWSYSQAVLSAKMSPGVRIEFRAISSTGLVTDSDTLSHIKEKANLILHDQMREFEVFVEFNASVNQNVTNSWCDDIRLIIVYDAYGEFQQIVPNIPANARWSQNGVTVAGGNGDGSATNQLKSPHGLFVDDDQTIVIVDFGNHRIVQWKKDDMNGQIVAGGKGQGSHLDQLDMPTDVLIDKETNSLIICDWGNNRVVRWSRRSDTTQGEILIKNITCVGFTMDDQRNLYISDWKENEVRQYKIGDSKGTLVAGGNGKGADLNQLNFPTYIFIDRQQTLYVSDHENHRVMKWPKGAKEGIVVAGGQDAGDSLVQLYTPRGLFVDTSGTLYVADDGNHRVLRWLQGAPQGTIIVGGNVSGSAANQVSNPIGMSFDRQGNIYVVDRADRSDRNHRVQRFSIQ